MKPMEIVRSWKDEEYRQALAAESRTRLPEDPAGLVELTDAELGAIGGAGEDRTWGGCYSMNVVCPGSNGLFCSFWGCATGDWSICSVFGCPSWNWPICM